MKASPSDCASSCLISAAESVSPSSVTSMRKSSSASSPSCDGALPPTVAFTCGRAGRFMRQLAGIRTTTPALSSAGTSLRNCSACCGRPAQRMKDLAGIDHRLQPGALLGGALDRHQQRQQALAVLRAGIFLQGLAERQMLRLGLRRQPRRVGRQERERGVLVLPVLGEIEMHASDQVPGGMPRLEEFLHRELRLRRARHRRPHPWRARDRPGPAPSDIPRRSWAARRGHPAQLVLRRAPEPPASCAPRRYPGSAHSAVT